MKNTFCIVIALALFYNISTAQLSGTQNPPEVKWKKIDTPHYEVIFPEEITKDGQLVANKLEYVYNYTSKTLNIKPQKLSVILQNQNTVSNAFVTLAPRRSEWFNSPPQTPGLLGANNWYDLLALHEIRHVVQYSKVNTGFNRLMYYLFGEVAVDILSAISIPSWYWEGDAVGIETALSNGGRGRLPQFDMEIRALLLSGYRYNYYKAYFGSFDDYYPDHYRLGYLMTTHIKRKYGADALGKVISRASYISFLPYSFSLALFTVTGKGAVGIYEDTMYELTALWYEQFRALNFTNANIITRMKRDWVNYQFPQYTSDGKIIALKWSLSDIFQFVRINPENGKEEKLFLPGQIYYSPMSVQGNKLVWNETQYDKRWWYRDYSIIKIYDLNIKETKILTSKTKFFAPAISPDMQYIAVVEFSIKNECSIVILNAETGEEIRRLPNPENEFIQEPRWDHYGKYIIVTVNNSTQGKAIKKIDTESGQSEIIYGYTFDNFSSPVMYNNHVYFSSPYSGIDNIYAIDVTTKEVYQVTSRNFGAFYPSVSPDGKKLLFVDYNVSGYHIAEMPVEPEKWVKSEYVVKRNINYYEPLISQEAGGDILTNSPSSQEYEVKNYNRFSNLINVHSWIIFADPFQIITNSKNFNLGLWSQDLLSTTQSSIGYTYNWNEKTNGFDLGVSYAGFYPIVDFATSFGRRTSTYQEKDKIKYYSWNETALGLGLRVPLNLTKDVYEIFSEFGISSSTINISNSTNTSKIGNGLFAPVSYNFNFTRGYKWIRDIKPVWGQSFNFNYIHTPFAGDFTGSLFSIGVDLFFPGLLKNQNLYLQIWYEKQNPGKGNYKFSSNFLFPRGYDSKFHEDIYKIGVNYALPLLYPDFSFLFTYSKRVRANLFYDYAVGKNGNKEKIYKSVGIELVNDVHLLSFPFSLGIGLRFSFKIEEEQLAIQPIIELSP